jgi:fructose-1,6-bisphosphatase/inositol monophosphatase family enzyme
MAKIDIDHVTSIIRDVARARILPRFRNLRDGDISFKIGDDPVTIADKEAESDLTTLLSDLLPGSKVVGEEAFSANRGVLEAFSGESPVWSIDPVDGTRQFAAGSSDFGVIVSLTERNQVVAGWIYDPTSNEVITAEKGSGSWYKGRKLTVSAPKSIDQARLFLGERVIEPYMERNGLKDLPGNVEPIICSAHTQPRLVIDRLFFGKNLPQGDFYAAREHSTPWDDGAGTLIHSEAGGYNGRWSGKAFDPAIMHKGIAFAPNKDAWNDLKNWVQQYCALPTE